MREFALNVLLLLSSGWLILAWLGDRMASKLIFFLAGYTTLILKGLTAYTINSRRDITRTRTARAPLFASLVSGACSIAEREAGGGCTTVRAVS